MAIKVLANNLLGDQKHIARFRTEARAAARLRHSSIVPVFGVGSSQDCHYYVMDFIEGQSLREWLIQFSNAQADSAARDETPSFNSKEYFEWVAEIGATICDALHYAHTQGVLHRDVKPANLMIDSKKHVWVADFGLAKLAEQQEFTKTGEVLGTPQYMPPETFNGVYDARSEIYGVGLTLYEMLAMRPAIEGRNAADTVRKAIEGVQISPKKFNASVPADLETVVLKSLSQEAAARYQTAGEMRDDLQRYLSHRPILARRVGIVERSLRWCRREPLIATLTSATFLLLVAFTVASFTGYYMTNTAYVKERASNATAQDARRAAEEALQSKSEALRSADEQRTRAEKNLNTALSAFNEVMQNITERGVQVDAEILGEVTDTTAANVGPEDAKLLAKLLTFFDELAENNSDELIAESATAAKNAGDIYVSLGQLRQADSAYSKALDRYQRLRELRPDKLDHLVAHAEVLNELAVVAGLRGQLPRAQNLLDEVRVLIGSSEAAHSDLAARFQFARAHRLLASIGSMIGWNSTSPMVRSLNLRANLGAMRVRVRTEKELEAIQTAIDVLSQLVAEAPSEVRYQAELARAYRTQAEVAARVGQLDLTSRSLKEAIDLFDKLLADNRRSQAIRYELATTLVSVDAVEFWQRSQVARASELTQQLLADSPDLPRYRTLEARTLEAQGVLNADDGKFAEAQENYWQAVRIYTGLLKDAPEIRLYQTRRSQAIESIADILVAEGKPGEAIEMFDRAVSRLQQRSRRGADSPMSRALAERLERKIEKLRSNSPAVKDEMDAEEKP